MLKFVKPPSKIGGFSYGRNVLIYYGHINYIFDGGDMGQRFHVLDEIRGITLCSMILYHAVWDLVYMFGRDWEWYRSDFAYIWQQSICWSFILLSGFCFSLGKKKFKRGLVIFGAGVVISLVTEIFMPQNRIRFGVLTLLGSCMLIMAVVEKGSEWIRSRRDEEFLSEHGQRNSSSAVWKLIICFMLFAITKRINYGVLGFSDVILADLPTALYSLGDLGNFLGFTEMTFYSTDYFSLMPWFFLYLAGYFLHKWFVEKDWMDKLSSAPSLGKWWRVLGKYSLIIYMLHQPVIYGILYVLA